LGRWQNQLAMVVWGVWLEDVMTVLLEGTPVMKTGKMGS
jgi:hypothetical protein